MKLVLLIASAMTAVLMIIDVILEQRYKRKRIAEIEDKLKGRYRK